MAEKVIMTSTDHVTEVLDVLSSRGLLLATWKQPDKPNAMTIGWGMIGCVWGKPIWQVLVRPSRYTYELIEREGRFSVNVMPKSLAGAVELCGTVSGRDRDKLDEANLTVSSGEILGAPIIDQSVIYYECRVLHANDFVPEAMVPDVRKGNYPSGDYHRVYWGEIKQCRVDRDALDSL